jgi:hypothetical protein
MSRVFAFLLDGPELRLVMPNDPTREIVAFVPRRLLAAFLGLVLGVGILLGIVFSGEYGRVLDRIVPDTTPAPPTMAPRPPDFMEHPIS